MSFPGYLQTSFADSAATIAAPGAMWTRSGTVKNAYIQNGVVVSSDTGFPVRLNSAFITYIAVQNDSVNTFDLEIYEWDGVTETLLATVNVVASRGANFTPVTPISITFGNELRAFISASGPNNAKNPVALCFIVGDVPA